MEVDYKVRNANNLTEVKEFLQEIGEDPSDYTNTQLLHMLEEGF